MPLGGAVYGLWLTLKGKVLADSFVIRGGENAAGGGETFWIGSYFSPAAVIKERLEAYVIADDVAIEDLTSEWVGMTVLGDDATAPAGVVVFPGRRTETPSVEWMLPIGSRDMVRAVLAGREELMAEDVERRRIVAGVPAVPVDIGPGDLPGEGALESAAISYTKGCYLGQEVMARLKSMGQVRRRLLRVAGDGEPPVVLPIALFSGDKKAGELRSAVRDGSGGWKGFAMLSLIQVKAEAALAFSVDAAPTVRMLDVP